MTDALLLERAVAALKDLDSLHARRVAADMFDDLGRPATAALLRHPNLPLLVLAGDTVLAMRYVWRGWRLPAGLSLYQADERVPGLTAGWLVAHLTDPRLAVYQTLAVVYSLRSWYRQEPQWRSLVGRSVSDIQSYRMTRPARRNCYVVALPPKERAEVQEHVAGRLRRRMHTKLAFSCFIEEDEWDEAAQCWSCHYEGEGS